MNIVEIIIKAITQDSDKGLKKTESNLKNLEKAGKDAIKVFNVMARTIGAVGLGFLGAIKFLQNFGDEAKRLNFTQAAKEVDDLNTAIADAQASILKFNIGGKQIQEWLGIAAEAMAQVIRVSLILANEGIGLLLLEFNELHVVVSAASTALQDFGVDVMANLGLISAEEAARRKATIATDQYTQALANADNAIVNATTHANDLNFANIGLAASLEKVAKSGHAVTGVSQKGMNTLKGLISANKALNDQYSKRKSMEDAIRAGDARALADAMYGDGGSGGGGRGGRGGSQVFKQGGEARGSRGQGVPPVNVNVFIGNQHLNSHINKQVAKTVFGGTTPKKQTTFPGKDQ